MRKSLLSAAGLTSLLTASCSLPSKERWAQINQHGLLPVLIDGRDTTFASAPGTARPSEQDAIRVQAVTTPVVVKTPSATHVPGRAGYAYSPHTTPRKVVDVRGYQPGEEVRCPFTGHAFLVPGLAQPSAPVSSTVATYRPHRRVTEVVSNDSSLPAIDESLTRLEPTDTPPVTQPSFEPARTADLTPAPAPAPTAAVPPKGSQAPYGTRVAGRPGFVYSPFAKKNQLVDVAGTAPGVLVKCPYTQKPFRVPEMAGEEVKPVEPTPAAADTANTTPPAPAETPAPAPAPAPEAPAPAAPGSTLGAPQP